MIDAIELHDAQLKSFNVDYVNGTASAEINFYEKPETDRRRIAARIVFSGVSFVSHMVDVEQLKTNFAAGNITNWWPNVSRKTYVYLAGGCLVVEARSVEFERSETS
jgi:hypothetical protein